MGIVDKRGTVIKVEELIIASPAAKSKARNERRFLMSECMRLLAAA